MKAYTLRLEDHLLNALKYIGIEEHKSVRELLLNAVKQIIASHHDILPANSALDKENLEAKKVSQILSKCSLENAIKSIRNDREQ